MILSVAKQSAYRAIGDPTRREILRLLREGDLPAGEIAASFDISWPSISRHLAVLAQAGLVKADRRGSHLIYNLSTSVLEDIATELAELAKVGRPSAQRRKKVRT